MRAQHATPVGLLKSLVLPVWAVILLAGWLGYARPASVSAQQPLPTQVRVAPGQVPGKLLIGPPQAEAYSNGQYQVRMNVRPLGWADEERWAEHPGSAPSTGSAGVHAQLQFPQQGGPEILPLPEAAGEPYTPEMDQAAPIFDQVFSTPWSEFEGRQRSRWRRLRDFFSYHPAPGGFEGVGYQRVPLAGFMIEPSQPFANTAFQFHAGYDWNAPDRAALLWAPIGAGGPPGSETSLDEQALIARLEIGGAAFSTVTSIPIRMMDPTENSNTAGLGDLSIMTKLRMVDGEFWQVTQTFGTHVKTGAASRGLGTGHVSLEPGFLFRYKWSPRTYFHGKLAFWFPVGAPPDAGEMLSYGLGVSQLWWDGDYQAAIATLEMVGASVLSGTRDDPTSSERRDVDGDDIVNIHPGLRLVFDQGQDFGLLEVGIVGGFAVTSDRFYESMIRLETRWSY